MKNTSTHKVMPVGEKNGVAVTFDLEEPCPEHKGKGDVFKFFCIDHEVLCCPSCVSQDHRNCQNIDSMDDVTGTSADETSINNITKRLGEIEAKTEVLKVNKKQNVDMLDKKYKNISDTLSSFIGKAKAQLDKFHIEFRDNLSSVHGNQRARVNERKQCIERFQSGVRNDQKILQTLMNQGASKKLFVATEKIKSRLKQQVEQLKRELNDDTTIDYELQMHDTLKRVTTTLKSSVELKVTERPCGSCNAVTDIARVVKTLCQKQTNHIDDKELEIIQVLDDMHLSTSTTPVQVAQIRLEGSRFHTGLFLPDGRLLFPDYNYEKLKIYNISGDFVFDFPLYRRPWDVACNSIGEIFVSFPNIMCIKKFKLSKNQFFEMGTMDTSGVGINGFNAILGNYVLATLENTVVTVGPDGKVMKSISVSTQNEHIAASRTQPRYYYTNGDTITGNSLNGDKLFSYSDPDIKNPISISVDISGHVYVCCSRDKTLTICRVFESGHRQVATLKLEIEGVLRTVLMDPEGHYFILIYHTGSEFKGRTPRSSDLLPLPETGLEAGVAKIFKMPFIRKLETQL